MIYLSSTDVIKETEVNIELESMVSGRIKMIKTYLTYQMILTGR